MHGFIRQREKKPTPVPIMAFMIGFAAGFLTCYILFRAPLPDLADVVVLEAPQPGTGPAPAETPAAEGPSAPEAGPPPEEALLPAGPAPALTPEPPAPLAELEALEDIWPARHLFVGVEGLTLDAAAQAFLADLKPGGVVLRDSNIQDADQTAALVRQIKQAVGLGIDTADLPLIAVSQEGGAANPLKLVMAPSPADLGRAYDTVAAGVAGTTFARECLARGIGVLLAPVLDIAEADTPAPVAERCFGTDRSAVAALGMAFADGAASAGVIPVAKYYPGGGAAGVASGSVVPALDGDVPAVAKAMFLFSEAIPCGIPGIMAGHIAVPVLDPGDPPRPASLSPVLVRTTLRGRLKYDGVVIADDLSAECITRDRAIPQAAVQALVAGCDALVIANASQDQLRDACEAIQEAMDAGGLSVDELSNSKRRLAAWQARLRSPAPLGRPLPELPSRPAEAAPAPEAAQPAVPVVAEAVSSAPEAPEAAPGVATRKKIVHEIKQGEMLSRLAAKYGVSQDDIMKWNNLKDKNIKYGFSLVIYVPEEAGVETPPVPEAPQPEAVAPVEEKASEPPVNEASVKAAPGGAEEAAGGKEPEGAPVSVVTPEAEPAPVTTPEPAAAEAASAVAPEPVTVAAPEPEVAPEPAAEPETAKAAPIEETPAGAEGVPVGMKKVVHEIKPGEALSRLAVKYGVSQDDIMKWNDLKDKNLKYGFNLILYVPEGFEVPAQSIPEPPAKAEPEFVQPPGTKKVVYTIKQGDALSRIAERYGVSQQDLIRWNNLTADKIKHGFALTLYVPETQAEPTAASETVGYTVRAGDTVESIAERFGLSVQELLRLNGLQEGFALQQGQDLKVPAP